MIGKKALRLATATLLVGVAMGAQQALPRHASAAGETGTVAITDWQFPGECNGVANSSVADTEVCTPMEDSLFGLGTDLKYFPDLNTDIPSTKNGEVKTVNGNTTVTYKLKPNLKWSDGQPLTVDDIIFSVKIEIAAGATFGLDQIKSMQKVDDRTVVFTYNGQYAPFIAYGNPSPLWPQHYLVKKYGTSDISAMANKLLTDSYNTPSDVWSGPYKLSSWTTNQSIVEVPNSYYTAFPPDAHHPRLAQFKFVAVSSSESDLAAALGSSNAGVDTAEDFQFADVPTLQQSKYHLTVQPALFVEHLELNQAGPLKDVRLRQALQLAVDKAGLFKQLFPYISNPTSYLLKTVLPNISPFVDQSLPLPTYDPAKARALIKAAGYSDQYNGPGKILRLKFATTSSGTRQKAFQILAKYWAQVGVHVSPAFTTAYGNGGLFDTYANNGVLLHRHFDIALFAFQEAPDPQQSEPNFLASNIPTASLHSGAQQNYNGINDKDQENLLAQARHTTDATQRLNVFHNWEKLVNSRVYWIMLYARPNIIVDDGKVGNLKPNPTQAGNEWNAYQWYRAQ